MSSYPIINNKRVIGIYRGDRNNKPVEVEQVFRGKDNLLTTIFDCNTANCNHTFVDGVCSICGESEE